MKKSADLKKLICLIALGGALILGSTAPLLADTIGLTVDANSGTIAWNGTGPSQTLSVSGIKVLDLVSESDMGVATPYTIPTDLYATFTSGTFITGSKTVTSAVGGSDKTVTYGFNAGGSFTVYEGSTIWISGDLDAFTLTAQRAGSTAAKVQASSVVSSIDATFEDGVVAAFLASYYNIDPSVAGTFSLNVDRTKISSAALPTTPQTLLTSSTSPYPFVNGAQIDMSTTAAIIPLGPGSPVPVPPTLLLFAPGLMALVGLRKKRGE